VICNEIAETASAHKRKFLQNTIQITGICSTPSKIAGKTPKEGSNDARRSAWILPCGAATVESKLKCCASA